MKSISRRRRATVVGIAIAAVLAVGSGSFAFLSPDEGTQSRPELAVVEEGNEVAADPRASGLEETVTTVGDTPVDDASDDTGTNGVARPGGMFKLGEKVPNDGEVAEIPSAPVPTEPTDGLVQDLGAPPLPDVAQDTAPLVRSTLPANDSVYDQEFSDAVQSLAPAAASLTGEAQAQRPVEKTGVLYTVTTLQGLKDAPIDDEIKQQILTEMTDGTVSLDTASEDDLRTKLEDTVVVNADMAEIFRRKSAEPDPTPAAQGFKASAARPAFFTICAWDDKTIHGDFALSNEEVQTNGGVPNPTGKKNYPTWGFKESGAHWKAEGSIVGYFQGTAQYNVFYGIYRCFGLPVWARFSGANASADLKLGVQAKVDASMDFTAKLPDIGGKKVIPIIGLAPTLGPFSFDLSLGVTVKYGVKLEASLKGELHGRINLEGSAKYGWEYVPGTGFRQLYGDTKDMKVYIDRDSEASITARLAATPFIDVSVGANASVAVEGLFDFTLLNASAGIHLALPMVLTATACLASLSGGIDVSAGIFADAYLEMSAYYKWGIFGSVNWGEIKLVSDAANYLEAIKAPPILEPTKTWFRNLIPTTSTLDLAGGSGSWSFTKLLFNMYFFDQSLSVLRPITYQTSTGIQIRSQKCNPFKDQQPVYEIEVGGDVTRVAAGLFPATFEAEGEVRVRQVDDMLHRGYESPWVTLRVKPSSEVDDYQPDAVDPVNLSDWDLQVTVKGSGQQTIEGRNGGRQFGTTQASAEVRVVDMAGNAVPGATVTGEWEDIDAQNGDTLTTSENGYATFRGFDDAVHNTVKFSVTNVAMPNTGYRAFTDRLTTVIDMKTGRGTTETGDTCAAGGRGKSVPQGLLRGGTCNVGLDTMSDAKARAYLTDNKITVAGGVNLDGIFKSTVSGLVAFLAATRGKGNCTAMSVTALDPTKTKVTVANAGNWTCIDEYLKVKKGPAKEGAKKSFMRKLASSPEQWVEWLETVTPDDNDIDLSTRNFADERGLVRVVYSQSPGLLNLTFTDVPGYTGSTFTPTFRNTAEDESGEFSFALDAYGIGGITNGLADGGGKTYGVYQFETRRTGDDGHVKKPGDTDEPSSTMRAFLKSSDVRTKFPELLKPAIASMEFDVAWKTIAATRQGEFGEAQERFALAREKPCMDAYSTAVGVDFRESDVLYKDILFGACNWYGSGAISGESTFGMGAGMPRSKTVRVLVKEQLNRVRATDPGHTFTVKEAGLALATAMEAVRLTRWPDRDKSQDEGIIARLARNRKKFENNTSTSASGSGSTTTSGASSPKAVGDLNADSTSVPCYAGTRDLGTHDGFKVGSGASEKTVKVRLCAIPGFNSSSRESKLGDAYYISGADGEVIVNSRVSGPVLSFFNAGKAAGLTFTASSTFRTMAHQQDLCNDDAGCRAGTSYDYVARPGHSNHQRGVAIDFAMDGASKVKGATCASDRAESPNSATWNYLVAHGHDYGIYQYAKESWHWEFNSRGC
jgi:D-alanyl-D-alanine carboxypeptidase